MSREYTKNRPSSLFLAGQHLIAFSFQAREPLRECPEIADFDLVVLMDQGMEEIWA